MKNYTNQKFGRLTAKSISRKEKRGNIWHCVCECGKTKDVWTGHLTTGGIRSCGCLREENLRIIGGANKKAEGVSAFNKLYSRYKKKAEERNLTFELTEFAFKVIINDNCWYCGIPPSQKEKTNGGSVYTYNGIDRLWNDIGYVSENCVACCSVCNFMKSKLDGDKFLQKIQEIYENRTKIEGLRWLKC